MNDPMKMLITASERLDIAAEELNRPDEDVMTISVCHQARSILTDLITAYLHAKGKDYRHASDLETLRRLAAETDVRFNTLDLESMICHPTKVEGEPCYCMGVDRVRECLELARTCKGWVEEALATT
jgi:hypothetical protein